MLSLLGAAVVGWLGWRAWQQLQQWLAKLRVLSALPHPSTTATLTGSLELIADRDHMHHALGRAAAELGGLCYVRILWQPLVVVTDPALCQQLLSAAMDLPKDPGPYHSFNTLTSPGGRTPNMLGHTASHGYWHLVRKGVAGAFSPRNIRGQFPHVLRLADQIAGILRGAGPAAVLDLDNLLQREAMDVIGRIGFQTDFGALEAYASGAHGGGPLHVASVFETTKGAALEIAKRWSQPLRTRVWRLIPDARRGEACLRAAQARMRALLAELKARGPPAEDDASIAAHLLRIRDPATGRPLTDEQLAGEVGLMFFAGFETTGHTMAWALFLLASHPQAAARVAAELDEHGLLVMPRRPRPRQLEYADLSKLKYLGQVLKESMRLVPVVAGGTARRSAKELTLRGHRIPAGTTLIVGGIGLHLSSHNWERADEFLPERWEEPGAEYWPGDMCPARAGTRPEGSSGSTGASTRPLGGDEEEEEGDGAGAASASGAWTLVDSDRPPLRFAPFSQGPRICIGQHLAKMNATATLALLLSRFTFELPPELRGPGALWDLQCNLMTNQPRDGLPMRCIPRPT